MQGRRFASRSKRENLPKGLGEAVNRLLCRGTGNLSPTKRIDTEFSAKFPIFLSAREAEKVLFLFQADAEHHGIIGAEAGLNK